MPRPIQRFLPLSLLLLIAGLLLSNPASAVRVENLYSVELPVPDQTTAERLKVFSEAMRKVLVKLTGDENVVQLPGLQGPIQRAARFVQEYRYSSRQPASKKSNANPDKTEESLYLRVHFDARALDRLLRENQLRLWGIERPSTLMLLAVQRGNRLVPVAGDTTPQLVAVINRLADDRGLPVLLPLNDLEDSRLLDARRIRNRDDVMISSLSARYAPDAVLVGSLTKAGAAGWRGEWQLRFSQRQSDWSFEAVTPAAVIDQALSRLARTLASEYALDTSMAGSQELMLTVEDVNTLDDLLRVSRYLKSLEAIEAVRPRLVEPNRVGFRLRLRNAAQDLSRLISLGDVLEQEELPQLQAGGGDSLVHLRYRLKR